VIGSVEVREGGHHLTRSREAELGSFNQLNMKGGGKEGGHQFSRKSVGFHKGGEESALGDKINQSKEAQNWEDGWVSGMGGKKEKETTDTISSRPRIFSRGGGKEKLTGR